DATVPGATYLWQDGSTASTFTTDQPGLYSVTVASGLCSATDQVTVSNFNLQTVDLGADVSVCAGTPVPLSMNVAGATYLWNNGSTSNAVNANSTGDWWVEVTLNGCSERDSV